MRSIRIPLHSRKYPGLYAIIDEADAELVNQYRWRVQCIPSGDFYAVRGGGASHSMHRFVLGYGPGDADIDHVDGDGLNNCKHNLRACTSSQNQANRHRLRTDKVSRFRGVTWHRSCEKWQAQIKVMGKTHYLGLFEDELDAACAYDQASQDYFGDFANSNTKGDAA